MAVFTPGPLINEISGRVGNTAFQRTRAGRVIHTAKARIQRPAPNTEATHELMRRANSAWRTLSAATQAAWSAAATSTPSPSRLSPGKHFSGHQLFIASYLHQAGASSITTPAVPSLPSPPSALVAGATAYASTLYLDQLSRPLTQGEAPIIHVYRPQAPTLNNCRGRLLRSVSVPATSQLTSLADKSLSIQATNQTGSVSASLSTSVSKCIECIFYCQAGQPNSYNDLFSWDSRGSSVLYGFNNYLDYTEAGAVHFGATMALSVGWHYLAFSWYAPTMALYIYCDGVFLRNPDFARNSGFLNNFTVGAISPTTASLGFFDEIRVSNIYRNSAWITATWNGGTLKHFTTDANVTALWNFDGASGVYIPDLSGNNNTLYLNGATLVPGYWSLPIAYASDGATLPTIRTWLRTSANCPANMGARSHLNYIDWVPS